MRPSVILVSVLALTGCGWSAESHLQRCDFEAVKIASHDGVNFGPRRTEARWSCMAAEGFKFDAKAEAADKTANVFKPDSEYWRRSVRW